MVLTKIPGGMSSHEFLADYWQKKPLLVRQAFPDWQNPVDADELAGLALEPDIEARIIQGSRPVNNWQLLCSPFDVNIFSSLPASEWTLLVQAVDQWIAGVATLKAQFRFLPDWRIDDVMVSYATNGGSVGPHVDQYDVFLVQGQGRRRWQLGGPMAADAATIPGLDVRVLAEFAVQEDYVLEPGDMLYLPPGWAHYGVAEGECMTYSVGFRAPSIAALLSGFCDELLGALTEAQRFSDSGAAQQNNPGEITAASLTQVRQVLQDTLAGSDALLRDWFGRAMTEPKYSEQAERMHDLAQSSSLTAIAKDLAKSAARGIGIVVTPASRIAYIIEHDKTHLFGGGESYVHHGDAWRQLAEQLCAAQKLSATALKPAMQDYQTEMIFCKLLASGVIDFDDPEND